MIKYPVQFTTYVKANHGIENPWEISSSETKSLCSIPPEFEGPGGAFSPEDLFAQALTNCFVATFKVMAFKSNLTFEELEVTGLLVVDRDESKRPCMKEFDLKIQLKGPVNPDRAAALVKKAIEAGFILNSVKTLIRYDLTTT